MGITEPTQEELLTQLKKVQTELSGLREKKTKIKNAAEEKITKIDSRRETLRVYREDLMVQLAR